MREAPGKTLRAVENRVMTLAFNSVALRRVVCSALGTPARMRPRIKCLVAVLIFVVSYSVKSLHAVDLAPQMYTHDQPFSGMVVDFDARAVSIAGGRGVLIPNEVEASDTSLLSRPPGYSIYLGSIYALFGRDFFTVQLIQNLLDSICPVLIFLIAGALLSWRVGLVSGLLAAVSHHLATISNVILPDSLCVLPLLAAVYLLLRAERDRLSSYGLYVLAGLMLGLSVWLRPNAVLMGPYLVVTLALISARRWQGAKRAGVMALVSFLVVTPITIRNYLIYHEFVPITDHLGLVLWEGIGEAGGERFGAVATDAEVGPQEAVLYNDPRYVSDWSTPDGIKRDHDRIRKSLGIIVRHPAWFAGVAFKRMGRMLRYSKNGSPVLRVAEKPDKGRQIDVYDPAWLEMSQSTTPLFGESIFWMRPVARGIQIVARETAVPFILIGALLLLLLSRRRALLIMMVPFYYLLCQPAMHTESRYTVAMQYFLFIFAAIVWVLLGVAVWNGVKGIARWARRDRTT